jgi:hypothetical protein
MTNPGQNEFKAMPLPAGIWTMNLNGTLQQLNITAVDSAGNMTGLLTSTFDTAVSGFWDEVSQKLSFVSSLANQSYAAFLFQDTFRMPGISGSVVFTLVGSFQDFALLSSDRLAFGWYAQIGLT